MSRQTFGRLPTCSLPRQSDYVATFHISVTSMAHQLFSWFRVFTCRQFITKSKALSLKGTLQQTNYQVTSSTRKPKFCELQPRSAVYYECSNINYRLFLYSLSLFHQFNFLYPLKSPKKVTFYQKPMSLLSHSIGTLPPGMFPCRTLFTLRFFYGEATQCMRQ